MTRPDDLLATALLRLWWRLRPAEDDRERGDVPGWVLITVMTVALVTLIWGLAQGQLQRLLTNAFNSFGGGGGGGSSGPPAP